MMTMMCKLFNLFRCRSRDEKKCDDIIRHEFEETNQLLALPRVSQPARLFDAYAELIFAIYKWDGEWRIGKVRSYDPNNTITVVWDDGFLQIGTPLENIRKPSVAVRKALLASFDLTSKQEMNYESMQLNENITHEESSLWDLARRGETTAVLRMIDSGKISANEIEMIQGHAGRSVLYHACVAANLELVTGLLARGAFDWDQTCRIAVTGNEQADDERDLLFDPDLNTFSDFVDYDNYPAKENLLKIKNSTSARRYDQIRTMLKQTESNAPRELFRSALDDCCVCHSAVPDGVSTCGHIACCRSCLTLLRDRRESGCPICRARIRQIFHVPATLFQFSSTEIN
uniref:RING-type domain-containing protein n=1 Tax=Aureoumbra lagunensis TaxID=44058 RepID=A0A7S3JQI8_9STRA